ncbi:MAG TPA: hypothetical protein VH593_25340 [Ktedonobacteraceae bacterium]|jgi:hypothetical protein
MAKIKTIFEIYLELLDSERFNVMEPYGESDDEISVDKVHVISAGVVYVNGRVVLKSGHLGVKRKSYVLDIDDLPEQIVKDILRLILEVL